MKNKIIEQGLAPAVKKLLSFLLAIVMLFTIIAEIDLSAYAAISGDYEYSVLGDGTVEITGYSGTKSNLTIPSTIDGHKSNDGIKKINNNETKAVTVSYEDEEIYFLFTPTESGVYNLHSSGDLFVMLCDSDMNLVEQTGDSRDYYSLKKGKTYYIVSTSSADSYPVTGKVTIGLKHEHKFSNVKCTICGISEYDYFHLDDGTIGINRYFGSASNITIPSTIDGRKVTYIGMAFAGCTNLISVTLPNSVTTISGQAFQYCENLKSISFGNSLKYIYTGAFYKCTSLTSITLPDSLEVISFAAFNSCTSLKSVNLSNKSKLKIIGEEAFWGCKSLVDISIPESVEGIGYNTFTGCNMISVTIPKKVSSIAQYTFSNCKNLKSIFIKNPNCDICEFETHNGECELAISDTATIYGYKNSTAEKYAKKFNRKFVAVDGYDCKKNNHCYVDGLNGKNCILCESPKPCTHVWDNGKVTNSPTVTATGVKTYTCTKCKATKTETIPKLKLSAPTLKATVNTNGTFTLSWNKITGAEKYEIYYKQADGSYKLLKTVTGTSYTTVFAQYGKQYSYKMKAVKGNTKSDYGKVVNATNNKKLQTPTLKVAVNSNGTFKMTWNKVTGATSYQIYYKQADGSYKLLKTVTGTSYTSGFAQYGKQYSYKVRAVTSKNSSATSAYSSVVNATNNKKLQTPTLKVSVNSNGTFKMTWNKVTGATSYQIYYKQADGSYKLLKTVTGTSYTSGFAQYGKQYSYKVRAVTSKNSSATSNFSSVVNAKNTKKLGTPTMKATVNKNGSFKLSWGKVTGATSYQIYWKQANGSYKLLKTVTGTSYTTVVAQKGKTYSYKVRAVTKNNSSATSNYSSVVSAKRK